MVIWYMVIWCNMINGSTLGSIGSIWIYTSSLPDKRGYQFCGNLMKSRLACRSWRSRSASFTMAAMRRSSWKRKSSWARPTGRCRVGVSRGSIHLGNCRTLTKQRRTRTKLETEIQTHPKNTSKEHIHHIHQPIIVFIIITYHEHIISAYVSNDFTMRFSAFLSGRSHLRHLVQGLGDDTALHGPWL